MNKGKFCVLTNCCAVQRNETYRIANFFKLNDYIEITNSKEADINVITTCGVTDETEEESFDNIKRILANCKLGSKVIISGCLPNICLEKIRTIFADAIIIPLDKIELFNNLIDCKIKIEDVFYNNNALFHHSDWDPRARKDKYTSEYLIAKSLSRKYNNLNFIESFKYATQGYYLWKDEEIFEIKISSGCVNNCSYCASRIGIGKYKSKDLNRIKSELEIALINGKTKVMLMGDELGAYGNDINKSLIDVIKLCVLVNPKIRIGIRYIHPDFLVDLYSLLKPYMKNIFFMCVSVQSASANVLKLMNRNNNIADIETILKDINQNYKHIFLHTQIIIGFPNEKDEDFYKTVKFLEKVKFDYIRYNAFSAREGTKAFELPLEYSDSALDERMKYMKSFCDYNRKERLYSRYSNIICESLDE